MKNEWNFYKCHKCGNVADLIADSGVKMVCCGEEMKYLAPNTVDATQEKHIPIATMKGDELTVTVSSVIHPMAEEHHIAWVAISQNGKTQRVQFDKTGEPIAKFKVEEGPIIICEYCNLHGIWTADIINYEFNETICSPEFSEGCIE